MICPSCGNRMEEIEIIEFDRVVGTFKECPNCGLKEDGYENYI